MDTSVTVKPSLAIAILKSGLNVNVPMFLWGPPGIGKSQIVAQVAADLNLPLIDIRAVLLDPVDLRGVPSVENGTTRWNPPNFLPSEGRVCCSWMSFPRRPIRCRARCCSLCWIANSVNTLCRRVGEFSLLATG